jgi:hypothetical protein
VIEMVTVLEGCTTKEQCYIVQFCGQKDSMQRRCIKKCFLFTVGSSSCKVVHNLVEKFSQGTFESHR